MQRNMGRVAVWSRIAASLVVVGCGSRTGLEADIDDDCNGVIDAHCDSGDCKLTLLVTGSTPSSATCIDFPVQAGSTGSIEYSCSGGLVTAELGGVSFSGTLVNGVISLQGVQIIYPAQSPDECTWRMTHRIDGALSDGVLSYSYSEALIDSAGLACWDPCTETGTVQINW